MKKMINYTLEEIKDFMDAMEKIENDKKLKNKRKENKYGTPQETKEKKVIEAIETIIEYCRNTSCKNCKVSYFCSQFFVMDETPPREWRKDLIF